MKVWLPSVETASGSSVFTKSLTSWLCKRGHEPLLQTFPHMFQYAPDLLAYAKVPSGAEAVITNSWNGFAFHRRGLYSLCIEHLFVLDPVLRQHKTLAQHIFHQLFLRRYLRKSYRTANRIIAVSHHCKSQILSAMPDLQVSVIPNGIDTDLFSPGPRLHSRAHEPFRLFFAGNPTRRKGVDLLPPIMRKLGPSFQLRISGVNEQIPQLAGLPNVVFLGRLSQMEMLHEYRANDALLAPTRLEGLPLTVLEAMSCGLPVVSTDCTSLPEAVAHEETGFICPVDNIEELCRAIRRLASDAALRKQMSARARKRAVDLFTLDRMGQSYLHLLTEC